MARKTKYDENTFPLLAEKNARDGLNDEQNAQNLGISIAVFYDYQNKYPEFQDAIKKGKTPVTIQVENSLIKKAIGYEYVEETIEYYPPKDNDPSNKALKVKSVKRTKKYYPPDTASMFGYLYNKARNEYKRNWDKLDVPIEPTNTKLPDLDKLTPKEVEELYEREKGKPIN